MDHHAASHVDSTNRINAACESVFWRLSQNRQLWYFSIEQILLIKYITYSIRDLEIFITIFKGNHPSQELPPPPPTQPPPPDIELLDFNKYGWLYMGAGLLVLLVIICVIKYCCCGKSKQQKELEDAYQMSQRKDQEMALIQREQYLGPGKGTKVPGYTYSASPQVVYGNKAVSTNRGLSLQANSIRSNSIHSNRRMMVYNPEYAGVQILGSIRA